jgi:hypothetical protein
MNHTVNSPKGAENYYEHEDARILWTLAERFIRLDTACRIDSAWSQRPSRVCWAILPDDPPRPQHLPLLLTTARCTQSSQGGLKIILAIVEFCDL